MSTTIFDPKFGAVPIFTVADTDQRNRIPFDQRRTGCLAMVFAPSQVWQLLPPPWQGDDSDWTAFCTGGYDVPAFTAFAISGQATQIELGDTILGTDRTFTWNTSNSGNVQADSISITDTTSSVVLASGLANDGSEVLTFSDITQTTISSQVWTIAALNTHAGNFSRTFTVNWLNKVYAGTSALAVLNGTQIQALAYGILSPDFNLTFDLAAGGRKFFATPDAMGSVNDFIDPDTGFNVAMADVNQDPAYSHVAPSGYSYALVTVTNAFAVATLYRLWRSQNVLNGTITVRMQ